MNLKEHKALLYEYECAVRELNCLREATTSKAEWFAVTRPSDVEISLPVAYAETLLRDRIREVVTQVKDMAIRIGVTVDCEA